MLSVLSGGKKSDNSSKASKNEALEENVIAVTNKPQKPRQWAALAIGKQGKRKLILQHPTRELAEREAREWAGDDFFGTAVHEIGPLIDFYLEGWRLEHENGES